jgi:hypothetical protein
MAIRECLLVITQSFIKEIKMKHSTHVHSCDNSECHNYHGPTVCKDHHEPHYPNHGHDHHPDHHHNSVDDILQRHSDRTNDYQDSQKELAQQQAALELHNLQVVHHLLNNEVRALLEQYQDTLCMNGYSTGIQQATNNEYVTAISLHLNDTFNHESADDSHHTQPPSKDSKSINQIRFLGVPQSSEIQCQYMNNQFQSKNFTLGLEPELHSNLSEQGDALLQDFINFVLLFKRAELTALR